MEFFDRKEEVIDIQLTQYGKHMLSKGTFKPIFYAFYDDDIIYDRSYGGVEEDQKIIEDRIKSTPRLKTQYVFSGREAKILKNNKSIYEYMGMGHKKAQVSAEKHYSLGTSLGTSALHESKAPAWSVKFLQGYLSGSTHVHEAQREITTFTFSSDTKTDYEDSDEENTKFVDITAAKRLGLRHTFRFYFNAGNSPAAPHAGVLAATGVEVRTAIDISSLSAAADIADAFKNAVNAVHPFAAFKATRDGAIITVSNATLGPARNSSVTGISNITVRTVTSGKGGSSRFLNLPQLDAEIRYTTFPVDPYGITPFDTARGVNETFDDAGTLAAGFKNAETIVTYEDGSSLDLGGDVLLLEIEEKNVDLFSKNFDIEIFKVEEDEKGIEELIPLYFDTSTPEIVDGILLDPEERKFPDLDRSATRCMIDYYLEIEIDNEIEGLTDYKAKNILIDRAKFPTRPLIGSMPRTPPIGSPGAIGPGDMYEDLDPNEEEPCD